MPSAPRAASDTNAAVFADLSAWTVGRGLVKLALDAVQTVDATRPSPAEGSAYQPRMMVTLLTYCYAKGLYGSRHIEEAIQTDPTVRYLCAREYPTWKDLQRFRRDNREWLEDCLRHMLKQSWAWKFDEGEVVFPGYERFETEFNETLRHEVRLRLDVARFIDRMESVD